MKSAQNLERNRQKKRAIGTLDVAFKKRFFALSGIVEPELERFVSNQKKLNAHPNSFQLSGEEDAPGGQADGTPKPHNINRKKAYTKIKINNDVVKKSNSIPTPVCRHSYPGFEDAYEAGDLESNRNRQGQPHAGLALPSIN